MSSILHIEVANKIATFSRRDGVVVCGNTDYLVKFTFDSEWSGVTDLTARFVWNDQYSDVPITNNECYMPVVKDTTLCKVGVYSGDKRTTTPAIIPCQLSILSGQPTESPDMPIRKLIEGTLTEVTSEMIQGATKIKDFAFYSSAVKKVPIPNSVKSIGERAFYSCKSLTSITIPNSVTSISGAAFRECTGLLTVIFAENSPLQTLGDSLFNGCTKLKGITVPASVKNPGTYTFNGCTQLGSVTFAEGSLLQKIGQGMFQDCNQLYEIIIPTGVTCIDSYAFKNCPLYEIVIPAGVTQLGSQVFQNCSNLFEIIIPASVKTIGYNAFGCCYGLYSVKYEGQPVIGSSMFNTGMTDTSIAKYDFRGATTVPTLQNKLDLGRNFSGQIIVPDALYDEWKAKTNWAALTNATWVKASEYTEE